MIATKDEQAMTIDRDRHKPHMQIGCCSMNM